MNTKNNQRYQETDERIVAELMRLLEEKDIEKVSVAEICRRCEINRASFYLHYTDIYDLMDKIDERLATFYGQIFGAADEQESLADSFIKLFGFIRDNKAFYRSYLSHADTFRIMEVTLPVEASENMMGAIRARGFDDPVEGVYHQIFFRDGLLAIVRHWIERDCSESPEYLVRVLRKEYAPIPDIFFYGENI